MSINVRLVIALIGLVGCLLVAIGVGLYDYRAGLIVGGLMVLGIVWDIYRKLQPSTRRTH